MSDYLKVYKDRTNTVPVNLGFDVSADTITSEIREDKDKDSTLIATWTVSFLTDGVDWKLILTLDNSLVSAITQTTGGATFTAIDSISISGNTGWNFVSGWVPKSIMIM